MDCMAIACKQGLTVLETNRLFFVEAMAPRLGEQGLLAWDEGRSLNLIRWSLAAGYITHQEALELARDRADLTKEIRAFRQYAEALRQLSGIEQALGLDREANTHIMQAAALAKQHGFTL